MDYWFHDLMTYVDTGFSNYECSYFTCSKAIY